ncbi:MAG: hypothetical protein G01um101431_973 [Parcubacteria group bacterium Gr01-1014_31]|nr:MAG: hypothetical protein G01um101431_973 [Parcubacteria group bacterium Gr01-1014_31]
MGTRVKLVLGAVWAVLGIAVLFSSAYAGTPPLATVRTYGGTQMDRGIAAFSSTGGSMNVVVFSREYGVGDNLNCLLSLDPGGGMTTATAFGGEGYEGPQVVRQTTDGFIMAGVFRNPPALEVPDAVLMKVSANGVLQWQYAYGTGGYDGLFDVRATSDGGFIGVGSGSQIPDEVGTIDRILLLKVDANGELQWLKLLGDSAISGASSVLELASGGYLLLSGAVNDGKVEVVLITTDADGNTVGQRSYGAPVHLSGRSMVAVDDGVVICGAAYENISRPFDAFLMKVDAAGEPAWYRQFGLPEFFEDASYLAQDRDGGFLLAGTTDGTTAGNVDVYLVKTDAAGILQWETHYGTSVRDVPTFLGVAPDGSYLITGYAVVQESPTTDYDILVIKTVPPQVLFLRADSNVDGEVDLSDAVNTLTHLFLGGAPLACPDAADANDSGELDISDAIYTLGYLFLGSSPDPPEPYPLYGGDPTNDTLGCDRYPPSSR